ncbi:MAG TPA: hypothetical protein VFQ25_07980 [Ktedonobacterales bacterium]|nr:hypothetical protein [Ktedonobacterales bacterium]
MTLIASNADAGADSLQASPHKAEIRLLFAVAALVFTVTVLIGLLNGQRVVQLSHDVLLTHVHAGTLGWITLGVFALSLWLFGGDARSSQPSQYVRWLSIVAAVAVPCYVAAFLGGNFIARAVFGVPMLLAVLGFFGWVIARANQASGSVARLALMGAYLTLSLGALLGVLLQFEFASAQIFLPAGAFSAHPGALVTGYLVLVGMAVSEWRLHPATRADFRLGAAQISCFFASGLLLMVAFLADIVPLLALNTLLLLAGVIIYIWRFAARVIHATWLAQSGERFFAASAVFIVINIALTVSLTVGLVTQIFTPENLPEGLLLTMDHTMFIGVMTNALFGMIQVGVEGRRAIWPWANDAVFWGMNIGLVGFAVGLITQTPILQQIFTPIMGLAILLAIGMYAWLLLRRPAIAAGVALPA